MTAGLAVFHSGAAVVDRSGVDVLRFAGPQARWFLDQLVTNRILELPSGSGVDALLLTPKGRITADMRIWATGDEALVSLLEPGMAAEVGPFFQGRVFATRVTIEDHSGAAALVSVVGPRAGGLVAQALSALGLPPAEPADEEHANVTAGDGDRSVVVGRVTRPAGGLDLLICGEAKSDVLAALAAGGAELRPADDLERLRIVGGLPRFGVDFDARHLPQEAALERAVHFAKGCYLGQEAVAMAQRGRVKRRIRHLAFDGPAAAGALVFDGKPAGEVTSTADDEGRGWGIATVSAAAAPGSVVEVVAEGRPVARAEVRELPGTHEGPRPPSARELRERLAGTAPPPGTAG